MICNKCGRESSKYIIEMKGESPFIWCEFCYSLLNTCNACKSIYRCDFNNDKRSPDFIMKQFQQGNQFIQMQIKNPDKVDIYCTKCNCWNDEYKYCMREWGICLNYKETE